MSAVSHEHSTAPDCTHRLSKVALPKDSGGHRRTCSRDAVLVHRLLIEVDIAGRHQRKPFDTS